MAGRAYKRQIQSWLILALTMFTSGMVFSMFNTLMGRWAMLPTWGLMVLLGNPSSGGAVSWPLLPSALVLAGWAVLSCTVFWVWRHRHPGGRETVPAPGP